MRRLTATWSSQSFSGSKAGGVSVSAGGARDYSNQFESSSDAQKWCVYWRSWSQGRADYNPPVLAPRHPVLAPRHFKEGM